MHRREHVLIAKPWTGPGQPKPHMFGSCVCNVVKSLRNRVLMETPGVDKAARRTLRKAFAVIRRKMPKLMPEPLGELHKHYAGRKAARYRAAAEHVFQRGTDQVQLTKWSAVKMFVKVENTYPKEGSRLTDPRAIQFRSYEYNVCLGRFIKPVEHELYKLRGSGMPNDLPKTRYIGKGLDQRARAELTKLKFESEGLDMLIDGDDALIFAGVGSDRVVYGIDVSRFDTRLVKFILELEHSIYTACYKHLPAERAELQRLLALQLRNRGMARVGTRSNLVAVVMYMIVARRMSGDLTTAVGNCVIMACLIIAALWNVDNDTPSDLVARIIHQAFTSFGFPLVVEGPYRTLPEIEWCQAHIIRVGPDATPMYVRDYRKVFAGALNNVKFVGRQRHKLVYTIGACEAILNRGVPILQEYAYALMANTNAIEAIELQEGDPYYWRIMPELRRLGLKHIRKYPRLEVTAQARSDFAQAFGVSIDEQFCLERQLGDWKFDVVGDETSNITDPVAAHYPFGRWEAAQGECVN